MSGDFESDIDKNTIIMNTSISMENITIDIFIHVYIKLLKFCIDE